MSTTSVPYRNRQSIEALSAVTGLRQRLLAFLFPAASDSWLSILRIGLGLQVGLYCLSLRGDWSYIFSASSSALISRELMEGILNAQSHLIPRLGWLVGIGERLGVSEGAALWTVWAALLIAACCLLVGLFCRAAAITAWLLHLCAVESGGLLTYGMDNFTTIGLFYLMLAPFPDRYALDRKLRSLPLKDQQLHGFWRRVLQLHVCAIYFFSGLTKCLGAEWWNGESVWRALTRAPFNVIPAERILSWSGVLPIAGIAICVLETGYVFFIWPRNTRFIWLLAILGMHLAIGLTMGLYLFALIMIVLNLAAFASQFLKYLASLVLTAVLH